MILGGFDGMTAVLGVLAALIAGGSHRRSLVLATAGLAVAEMTGMAGGEWLGDQDREGRSRRTLMMGLAVLAGVVLPSLPYLVSPTPAGAFVSVLVIVVLGVAIAHFREDQGGYTAYVQTFAVMGIAGLLAVLCSLVLGGAD